MASKELIYKMMDELAYKVSHLEEEMAKANAHIQEIKEKERENDEFRRT